MIMKRFWIMAIIASLSGLGCVAEDPKAAESTETTQSTKAAEATQAPQKPFVVVMMGDSTTLCSASEPGKKLTGLVQASLTANFKLNVNVVNAGVGSDTIKGGFGRLERDVLKHNPDLVTISFGLNDTGLLTPEEFDEFLGKTVDALQEKTNAKIILVTSTPFVNAQHFWNARFAEKGGLDEYMDANICAKMRALAEKRKLPICDLHTLFKAEFKKDPTREARIIKSDGVHPTDEGNALSAKFLAPVIAEQLNPKTDTEK
jgi:lysophospholipase L1-like esterase